MNSFWMMEEKWNQYFQDELKVSEKSELFKQLDADESAMQDFVRLNNAWGIFELLLHEDDSRMAQEGKKRLFERMRKNKIRRYLIHLARYAAVICVVAMVTRYLAATSGSGEPEIVYTELHVPSGQRLHITLADGSSVWLSPQTRMRLPSDFSKDNREIEIDGEGFFTIAKDEKRPFIVSSKGYNVEVSGTKFNLFSYTENPKFEVRLLEGKVHVYADTDKANPILLAPHEKVSLVNDVLVKSAFNYTNEAFLASGIYDFQSTPFSDILDYLSLWYEVRFEIKEPALLATKVTAKFRLNDDIERILTALQNAFRFNFKIVDERTIEIYS